MTSFLNLMKLNLPLQYERETNRFKSKGFFEDTLEIPDANLFFVDNVQIKQLSDIENIPKPEQPLTGIWLVLCSIINLTLFFYINSTKAGFLCR